MILPRTKLGPHRQHYFQLENVEGKTYTHVKLTIHPDGGVKRLRVIGKMANSDARNGAQNPLPPPVSGSTTETTARAVAAPKSATIPVLPLTPEAFVTFGQVIQAYNDHNAAPRGTKVTPANGGTASKFHKLSLLSSSYPPEAGATTGLSVYRCQPLGNIVNGKSELTVLERHAFTNQAFVPMGKGIGEGLEDPGKTYLVVVAQNGSDDRPNLATLRAFVASAAQAIMYNAGIWREFSFQNLGVPSIHRALLDQPMTVLRKVRPR